MYRRTDSVQYETTRAKFKNFRNVYAPREQRTPEHTEAGDTQLCQSVQTSAGLSMLQFSDKTVTILEYIRRVGHNLATKPPPPGED